MDNYWENDFRYGRDEPQPTYTVSVRNKKDEFGALTEAEIEVSDCYDIKDQLKALDFMWNAEDKVWFKTFFHSSFSAVDNWVQETKADLEILGARKHE